MHALEIKASADELTDDVSRAIRKVRSGLHMNGFRPGKVPQSLVRTLHRGAIEEELKSVVVAEVYEDLVDKAPDFSVCAGPRIATLEYALDGDLHAVVEFGVRPEIELRELDGEVLETMVHTVTEEDIKTELTVLRKQKQVYVPQEDSPIEDKDTVLILRKELDAATGLPLVSSDEDVEEFLIVGMDYTQIDPEFAVLSDALLGARVGETILFTYEPEEQEGLLVTETGGSKAYNVLIVEVRRAELPEMDDAFAFDISRGEAETMDALRDIVRNNLEAHWAKECLQYRNQKIVDKMLELHPIPVPEMLLDELVENMAESESEGDSTDPYPMLSSERTVFLKEHGHRIADRTARWRFLLGAVADAHKDSLKEILKEVQKEFREHEEETLLTNMESVAFRVLGLQAFQDAGMEDPMSFSDGLLLEFLSRQFKHIAKDSKTIQQEEEHAKTLIATP